MFSAFQTFGRLGAGARAVSAAWSPLALWPDGAATPGLWISPRDLTSQWQDSTGTTPVATPGTVADTSNPVGLALDIRAGAPEVLGPELVVNGDFSDGTTGWTTGGGATLVTDTSIFPTGGGKLTSAGPGSLAELGVAGLTAGKLYLATVRVYLPATNATDHCATLSLLWQHDSGARNVPDASVQYLTYFFTASSTTQLIAVTMVNPGVAWSAPGDVVYITDLTCKEVPGNHLLQATSTARPLLSGRVNLLTYTEDFTNAWWLKTDVTAPTSTSIVESATYANHRVQIGSLLAIATGATYAYSVRVKRLVGTRNIALIGVNAPAYFSQPFVLSGAGSIGTLDNYGGTATISNVSIVLGDDGYYTCSLEVSWSSGASMSLMFDLTSGDTGAAYTGDGVSSLQFDGIQWQAGSNSDYQSVPGNGSTYTSTGFPIFQKYDGTDDGMATASFAAGTLSNAMDCMIAVRRDSAGNAVCGLYESVAEANKVFGIAESGSGSGCVGSGAGTPTVWVDGVQLTGGTAVTRGTLHTALTVGDYHVLEFRGLDLSTWTASGFGLYTSYVLNGAQGGILLFPSSTSAADRDAARTWLADYYGVTLP